MRFNKVKFCKNRFLLYNGRNVCSKITNSPVKRPYHPFYMFEPNIFYFHTCNVTDNHFPKHTTGTVN
ncbi:hypothetical protein LDENG_00257860 [Lucifuga dentata]|nr:hypothetical protein LDENG_00257860 [Lucifuga dentata]